MNFWAFFKGSKYVEATTIITIKSSYHFTSCYVHLCTNRIIYVPIPGDLSRLNLVSTARPGRSPLMICSPEKNDDRLSPFRTHQRVPFLRNNVGKSPWALVAKAF